MNTQNLEHLISELQRRGFNDVADVFGRDDHLVAEDVVSLRELCLQEANKDDNAH